MTIPVGVSDTLTHVVITLPNHLIILTPAGAHDLIRSLAKAVQALTPVTKHVN